MSGVKIRFHDFVGKSAMLGGIASQGEKWRYEPPANHTVAWIAVHEGKLATPEIVDRGELAVSQESNDALEFDPSKAGFVLGSAAKHPHDLVLCSYEQARARPRGGKIAEIGRHLQAEGRL